MAGEGIRRKRRRSTECSTSLDHGKIIDEIFNGLKDWLCIKPLSGQFRAIRQPSFGAVRWKLVGLGRRGGRGNASAS